VYWILYSDVSRTWDKPTIGLDIWELKEKLINPISVDLTENRRRE
jgi:hypothetical protein